MKKKIFSLMLAVMIFGTSAAGCGKAANQIGKNKVSEASSASAESEKELTAEEIAEKAVESIKEVQSFSMMTNLDFTASTNPSESASSEVTMNMELKSELNRNLAHSEGSMTISTGENKTTTPLHTYVVTEDGQATTYISSTGNAWTKQSVDMPDLNESAPAENSLYNSTIYASIGKGETEAELQKQTKKINGKDAYVLKTTLSGELLSQALTQIKNSMQNVMPLADDLSKVSAPTDLYIYKDTFLPAGMNVDAKSIFAALLGAAESSPLNIDVKEYNFTTTLDEFGKFDDLKLPDEVKEASSLSTSSAGSSGLPTPAAPSADSAASAAPTESSASKETPAATNNEDIQNADWKEMIFSLDGVSHKIPFPYSEISKDWTFNLADYGYDKGYVMNPGDKVTGTITVKNDKYSDVRTTIGFKNTASEVKDILDTDIWAFSMDISSTDTYPALELPGGITWGSTADEILAKYGQPDEDPYVSKELGYTVYNWFNDYTYKMKLTVYNEGGLKAFSLEDYNR